jgi:PAS domain-containing protein
LTLEAGSPGIVSPGIVDNLVGAVLVLEDRGRVLYANPAVGPLLGRDVRSLFGEPFTALVPEHKRAAYRSYFQRLIAFDPTSRSGALADAILAPESNPWSTMWRCSS